MTFEGLVPPEGREGITTLPERLEPRRTALPRRPFRVLDLRSGPEPAAVDPKVFAKSARLLDLAYAAEPHTKADPLYLARDLTFFTGLWHRGEPIQGSVLPRSPGDLAARRARVQDVRLLARAPVLPGTTAVISGPGERNYFHWTTEIAPRLFALRAHRAAGGRLDRILLAQKKPAPYIREVLELFFGDLAGLVQVAPAMMTRLEEAVFFVDHRFVSGGGEPPRYTRFKRPTMLMSEAADALIAGFPRPAPGRAVLVSRADAPTRKIVNEAALTAALAPEGLAPASFAGMPVRAQAELMAAARLVIGAHGAGLTNLIYCRPGTAVIEITTTQYMRRCRSFADIAMHRGLRYALAVVDQHGERWTVEKNIGNDMAVSPAAAQAIAALAREMMASGI